MSSARSHRPILVLCALTALGVLAFPVGAAAATGAATITACKADRMTIAARISARGAIARKVRGAKLEMRFQALPLFGLPRALAWQSLGAKRKATATQEFTGLSAESWAGYVSWRFKKGRRTVLQGSERTQPVRIGRRGRANCVIAEGVKPLDTTAPTQFINPSDDKWHRGPAAVTLVAQDDFSGVQSVQYSVDGGPVTPLKNGGTFEIPSEGSHNVQWAATDVAGNTATQSAVVKVDSAPPSKPKLSRPFSVTASLTPTFQWSASTDSGSGLRGYGLTIKRADGSVVSFQAADAGATSIVGSRLDDGQTYTAVLAAIDNTEPAWGIESDPISFRVDTTPEIVSASPASGTVLAFGAKSSNLSITLDRPAARSTVSASTVKLTRDASSTTVPAYSVTCGTPCTTITVNPDGALPEGRYSLSISGVRSEENLAFAGGPIRYAVPAYEDPSASTSNNCGLLATHDTVSVPTTAGNETIIVAFSYAAGNQVGEVRALNGAGGGSQIGTSGTFTGSGSDSFTFDLASAGPVTLEYCLRSGSGTINFSNIYLSRSP